MTTVLYKAMRHSERLVQHQHTKTCVGGRKTAQVDGVHIQDPALIVMYPQQETFVMSHLTYMQVPEK